MFSDHNSVPYPNKRCEPESETLSILLSGVVERHRSEKSSNPVASRFRNQGRDLSLRESRDNKTPLELFLAGVRALALQSCIIDVVRIVSRFSSGTGGH
jgi:hypothetical protein